MRFTHEYVMIPGPVAPIRAYFARPKTDDAVPAIVMYSDIFQLTPSTLRVADRDFGMAAAKATPVAEFDEDARAEIAWLTNAPDILQTNIGTIGFCLGGHLAYRAALDPRISAAVCFYPTGLHNGALGLDADAGTLEATTPENMQKLHLIFGTEDPHVPAVGREKIINHLRGANINFELTLFPAEHAFMRDEGPRYDPEATDAAFTSALATLNSMGR
jgi:carboxymethylenebutenolidase